MFQSRLYFKKNKMKIFLTNQKLKKHLDDFKTKVVMKFDKNNLIEKTTIQEINTTKRLNEIDITFLFDYKIFPGNIMSYKTQWNDENRTMRINDTIVQQAFLPPFNNLSQKIIFGVRINEIINETNRKGFSYETIEGHIEKGISTFTIEELNDKIIFKIHTFSTPGNLLTKIVGPLITIPYQTYCTKKALQNVKRQIEMQ